MSSRHVFAQSVLLPRLLAAIGAGGLFAAPGCGGKTEAPAGEVSNAVDGKDRTTGEETKGTKSQTTMVNDSKGSTAGNTGLDRASTQVIDATVQTTAGSSTVNYIETDPVPTVGFDAGGANTTPRVNPDGAIDSAVPPVESTEPTTDSGAAMCEYGSPQIFCVGVEGMEDMARWGIGNVPRDEPLRSDEEIAAGWDENHCMKHEWIASSCCNPALAAGEPQTNGTCCYAACEGVCCGRPFMVDGSAVVARVVPRADWLVSSASKTEAINLDLMDPVTRTKLAQAWLDDATMEHASIASFSRFTLDLLQLGAPPELVRDSNRAAIDEIEHARIGFAVASRLAGTEYGPGNLKIGTLSAHSLDQAIVAAIIEGCVGETLAAGVVAEQARQCTEYALATQLQKIADDELRHSELAWSFVAWALSRFGDTARAAVHAGFAQALATLPQAPADLGLTHEVLHAAGRISPREWNQTIEQVVRDVIEPAVAALVGGAVVRTEGTPLRVLGSSAVA